jgi:hypothetical protein
MNQFLASRFSESVSRLALGIEPTDPVIRSRIGQRIEVSIDGTPFPLPTRGRDASASPWVEQTVLRRIDRKDSCRHVLLFTREVAEPLGLRFQDPSERYVPRRLLVSLPNPMLAGRQIRPALFPGAAYGAPAGAMGMRGRVVRGGEPMRWARVEARRTVDDVRVGFAHGDEHGEFLLLLDASASRGADLILPLEVQVTVFGPDDEPDPDDFPDASVDPFWDMPVETVGLNPAGEAVLGGRELPAGYASRPNSIREVEFSWHGLVREEFDFS